MQVNSVQVKQYQIAIDFIGLAVYNKYVEIEKLDT